MKKYTLFSLALLALVLFAGCGQTAQTEKQKEGAAEKQDNSKLAKELEGNSSGKSQTQQTQDNSKQKTMQQDQNITSTETPLLEKYQGAILKTNLGDIELEFSPKEAPLTVNNFYKLAEEKFYDGTKFHRVIKNFMIQGGDPNSKDDDWSDDGIGGPGYTIPAEIGLKNEIGTIATARTGGPSNPKKNSSGSQFYINTAGNTSLDGEYTVFGKVVSGMDVVTKIENVQTNENDHPTQDVTVESVELIEK
jgi:cyclophilin family peptidyl-prolyl cis-trans isomerase